MFLPSEIARLVLGYLIEMGCKGTSELFMCECKHLEEFVQTLDDDFDYPTSIGGKTLIEILHQYCRLIRKAPADVEKVIEKSPTGPKAVKSLVDAKRIQDARQSLLNSSGGLFSEFSSILSAVDNVVRQTPISPSISHSNKLSQSAEPNQNSFVNQYIQVPTPIQKEPLQLETPIPRPMSTDQVIDPTLNIHPVINTVTQPDLQGIDPTPNIQPITNNVTQTDLQMTSTPAFVASNFQVTSSQVSQEQLLGFNHVRNSCTIRNQEKIEYSWPMSCPPVFGNINSPVASPMQFNNNIVQKINEASPSHSLTKPKPLLTPESGPQPRIPHRHPYYLDSPQTLQTMNERLPHFSLTTPSKNTSKHDSPRRKNVTPRRRLMTATPNPKEKTCDMLSSNLPAIFSSEPPEIHNEDSYAEFNVWFEQLLHAQPLHEKIAENINNFVSRVPEPVVRKEIEPPRIYLSNQELSITDKTIREIINKTESDPVFETIINMFEETPLKNADSVLMNFLETPRKDSPIQKKSNEISITKKPEKDQTSDATKASTSNGSVENPVAYDIVIYPEKGMISNPADNPYQLVPISTEISVPNGFAETSKKHSQSFILPSNNNAIKTYNDAYSRNNTSDRFRARDGINLLKTLKAQKPNDDALNKFIITVPTVAVPSIARRPVVKSPEMKKLLGNVQSEHERLIEAKKSSHVRNLTFHSENVDSRNQENNSSTISSNDASKLGLVSNSSKEEPKKKSKRNTSNQKGAPVKKKSSKAQSPKTRFSKRVVERCEKKESIILDESGDCEKKHSTDANKHSEVNRPVVKNQSYDELSSIINEVQKYEAKSVKSCVNEQKTTTTKEGSVSHPINRPEIVKENDESVDLSILPTSKGLVYTYFKNSNVRTLSSYNDYENLNHIPASKRPDVCASNDDMIERSKSEKDNHRTICKLPEKDVNAGAPISMLEQLGDSNSNVQNAKKEISKKEKATKRKLSCIPNPDYSKKLKKLTDLDAFLNKVHGKI